MSENQSHELEPGSGGDQAKLSDTAVRGDGPSAPLTPPPGPTARPVGPVAKIQQPVAPVNPTLEMPPAPKSPNGGSNEDTFFHTTDADGEPGVIRIEVREPDPEVPGRVVLPSIASLRVLTSEPSPAPAAALAKPATASKPEPEDLEKLPVSELMMRLLAQCWLAGPVAELLKRALTFDTLKDYELTETNISDSREEYDTTLKVGADKDGEVYIRIESEFNQERGDDAANLAPLSKVEIDDLQHTPVSELMMQVLSECWNDGLIAKLLKRARELYDFTSYQMAETEITEDERTQYITRIRVGAHAFGAVFIRIGVHIVDT